jgi:hypothetical protein
MFRVLESHNKIFTLSPHILQLAMDYNISGKQINKLRKEFTEPAIREVKDYEKKKLAKD